MGIDPLIFEDIRDDATREAVIELWKNARDAARALDSMVRDLQLRIERLESRVMSLESRR